MTFPFPISQLEASLLKMIYSEPENQSLSRWLLTLRGRGRVTLFLSLPKLQSPLWGRSTEAPPSEDNLYKGEGFCLLCPLKSSTRPAVFKEHDWVNE